MAFDFLLALTAFDALLALMAFVPFQVTHPLHLELGAPFVDIHMPFDHMRWVHKILTQA